MESHSAEDVFCDLMELPHAERVAALDAMAADEPVLRAEVMRLLQDVVSADAYFTGTAVAVKMMPSLHPSSIEGIGDMVGPYQLIRKLGEGGFGVVWHAEQSKPLKRHVAVKVIKAGMDSAEVLARFDAEKQALARMEHPNIAKVLEAGMTEAGRPFFAMELVEGRPITQYCQEETLSTRDKLKLFADVCTAVNHAHQKGVIHRDIKPSNVLVVPVESKPVVKVIDFGIAKAIDGQLTDHTLRTRAEQWIGTPAYMSPEQAAKGVIDLDTRSDIYALGVILYELITGSPPFDSATLLQAGYEEMRRIIREVEPPRPSVRIATASRERTTTDGSAVTFKDRTMRRTSSELDWIVMKAMEKAKERRYESAAALAGDVGRYLSDEPIEARPPSSLYLLAKFARRHRLGIHVASAFLVLIVGAVLLSIWLALRAYDAEQIARERLAEALKDRNSKNQALEEAESVSRLLTDVFQRPRPGVDGRRVTVVEALDTAADKLDAQLVTQPQRRVALRGVLADTYEGLGIFDRSLKLREQNFETFKETSGPNHLFTRMALRQVVAAAEAKGDSKIAMKYALLENAALREASATPHEIETSMRSVIRGWFGVGDRKQAIEQQRGLVAYCGRTFGVDSQQDIKAKWELRQYEASMHHDSGPSATQSRKPAKETELTNSRMADMIATEKDFANLLELHGPMHTETIEARMKLVDALLPAGHTIEALIHLQALQSISMELSGPHDDRTLRVQKKLAWVYYKLSRLVDVVRIEQAIVNALRDRDGDSAETTVDAEDDLERSFFYSSLQEEYAAYLKDLLRRRHKLFGKDHVNTVMLQVKVGAGNVDETVINIQNAIRVMRENYGNNSRATAEAMAALARTLAHNGRTNEAIRFYAECAPNMLDDTWLNFECAAFQLWTGDQEGFRKTRGNIVNYWERRIPGQKSKPEMFDRMLWLSCIAGLDDEQQKNVLKRVLDHVESVRTGLHIEADERHSKPMQKHIKGTVLYRFGKHEEALATFQEANRLMNSGKTDSSAYDYQHPSQWVYFFMAMTQHRLGNDLEAERLFNLGESRLQGSAPSRENPVVEYFIGGEALAQWIIHGEAKALIFGE